MRFSILHRTTYRYTSPVDCSFHQVGGGKESLEVTVNIRPFPFHTEAE
ncbi:MAG: hypothetical protein ACXWUM_09955 [Burkholderiaceae bacterium]